MKGLLVITLSLVLGLVPATLRAQDTVPVNPADTLLYTTYKGSEGTTPATAADDALGASMMGWGIALAVGIAILAIVLGSNDNSQAHAHS